MNKLVLFKVVKILADSITRAVAYKSLKVKNISRMFAFVLCKLSILNLLLLGTVKNYAEKVAGYSRTMVSYSWYLQWYFFAYKLTYVSKIYEFMTYSSDKNTLQTLVIVYVLKYTNGPRHVIYVVEIDQDKSIKNRAICTCAL